MCAYCCCCYSDDLDKAGSLLFRHNLIGTLESAIRGSNAQYDNQDILNRLDIRLLPQHQHQSSASSVSRTVKVSTTCTHAHSHSLHIVFCLLFSLLELAPVAITIVVAVVLLSAVGTFSLWIIMWKYLYLLCSLVMWWSNTSRYLTFCGASSVWNTLCHIHGDCTWSMLTTHARDKQQRQRQRLQQHPK